MENNRKQYVKPLTATFTIESSTLLDGSYGDGHEHDNIHIGGTSDQEWFSKEHDNNKVVWDNDDEE